MARKKGRRKEKRNAKCGGSSIKIKEPKMRSDPFRPHTFDTKYLRVDPIKPVIYIYKDVLETMYHFVNLCDKEIGWLGTVRREDESFIIDNVFLLKQNVSGSHTRFEPEAVAAFYNEIMQLENGADLANRMLFWGHSHVNMDTFASGQDNEQMKEFEENGNEWFIRGIFNKKGKISFSIYFYKDKLIVNDVEWCILNEWNWDEEARIKVEIESKVSTTNYHHQHGNSGTWCKECKKTHYNTWECPYSKTYCRHCMEFYNAKDTHVCTPGNSFPTCTICKTNHHVNYDCTKKELKHNISKWCQKCTKFHTDSEGCKLIDVKQNAEKGQTFCNVCKNWHDDKEHKCSNIIASLTHRTHRLVRKIMDESVPKNLIGSDKSTEIVPNSESKEDKTVNFDGNTTDDENSTFGYGV